MKRSSCRRVMLPYAFILFAILALSASGIGQSSISSTNNGGNWSSPSTWAGGVVPTTTSDVIIKSGAVIAIDVTTTVRSLTIEQGGAPSSGNTNNNSNVDQISFASTSTSPFTLTVTGAFTVGSITTGNADRIIKVVNGTLVVGSLTLSDTDKGSRLIQIIIGTGTLTVNGSINMTSMQANRNSILVKSGGVLNIGGEITPTNGGFTLETGSSVNYNGTSQNIRTATYYNLLLSNSGTKTLTGLTTVVGDLGLSGTVSATTAAALSVGGNLNIGAGSQLYVAGFDFSVSGATTVGGTLTHNSALGIKTYSNNVTVNSTGVWNNTGNAAVTFNGSLANFGTFNAGTGVHTFGGTSKSLNGNLSIPNITVNGTYTNSGTLAAGTSLAGTGTLTQAANANLNIGGTSGISSLNATANENTVQYNGSGAQTIGANNGFFNLITNNPAGVTLTANTSVAGLLTLQRGNLIIPAGNVLTLNTAHPIGNGENAFSDAKHIVTRVDPVTAAKGVLQVNGISNAYLFPVGNGTYYLPATVTPSIASGFSATVFQGVTRTAQPDGELLSAATRGSLVDATWEILKVSANAAVSNIKLEWPDALEGADFKKNTAEEIGISRYLPSTKVYDEFASKSSDATLQSSNRSGFTEHTQFIVGTMGTTLVLPVRFAHVKAARQAHGVQVSFSNLTEEDITTYYVERSANGRTYLPIATLTPKANNNGRADYQYLDRTPLSGENFYRIRAVEGKGREVYSTVVKVGIYGSSPALVMYPNPAPAGSVINLQLSNMPAGVYSIRLFNESGQVLSARQIRHNGGSVSEALLLGSAPKGRYLVDVKGVIQFTQSFLIN